MDESAQGMLLVWTDVEPSAEEDFNAWYDEEHLPERVGVPGFIGGWRYHGEGASPRYFAVYGTKSVDVLSGPEYLERLNNPTPWTQRVMPTFRNTVRAVCRLVGEQGGADGADGGAVLTLRFNPRPGGRDALREALLAELSLPPGVTRLRLGETVSTGQATSRDTAETNLRGWDATTDFVWLMDGPQEAALEAARTAQLPDQRLLELGVEGPVNQGLYRLCGALTAES